MTEGGYKGVTGTSLREHCPVKLCVDWPEWSDMDYVSLTPYLDLYEEETNLILKAHLQDANEQDVKVSVEERELVVQVKQEGKPELTTDESRSVTETGAQGFHHRIELPFQPDSAEIEVLLGDNALEIRIPKPSPEQAKRTEP